MIKTRFCPSPTGYLHMGVARTALFSALFSVQAKGVFLLRIEDTDAARSLQKYTDMLLTDLNWLGIEWQEGPTVEGPSGPYWQSQRNSIYETYYQTLSESHSAYPCFCTDQELALHRKIQLTRSQAPRYSGKCKTLSPETVQQRIQAGEKPALRFRVPANTMIEFLDSVKGPQRFNSDDIGDFIIRRADGSSSFMFCNAIDDSLMGVTHVLRGEDHLTNTPRQLMILKALNKRAPHYGHLSLIIGDDGGKLSKREGSISLNDMRLMGYLPIAIVNYLARLGHTYDQSELMSFQNLAEHFHLSKLSRSSARFDGHQLLHWQKEAVLSLTSTAIEEWLGKEIMQSVPSDKRHLFTELMRQNSLFPSDAIKWQTIFFTETLSFTEDQLIYLKDSHRLFESVIKGVEKYGTDIKSILNDLKSQLNVTGKALFMPIRLALTAEEQGPELMHIANILGERLLKKRFEDIYQLTSTAHD